MIPIIMHPFSFLKSMTAYGRESREFPIGRIDVEIHGVNRRHLEVSLSLPKELLRFDQEIRKLIGSKVSRGQVSLFLSWKIGEHNRLSILPNIPLAKGIKQAWEQMAAALHLPCTFNLQMLVQEKDILIHEEKKEDDEAISQAIRGAVFAALEKFDHMRQKEGEHLAHDFKARLDLLQEKIEKIEELAKDATEGYRQKLTTRLNELFEGSENEERILKEVALLADKIDITEEIVRFKSHLGQMDEVVSKGHDAKGKKIEFLLQELAREMNTIGAKTNKAEVSTLVIDCKCELERMREQAQNIE